jgi:formate dehydrogenase subunit gamma
MVGILAGLLRQVRVVAGGLALAFIIAMVAPVSAQQPSSVNPTASAVQEQQLLKELNKIQGRGTIPDVKSYVLEHPAGRDWRHFHTVTLKWLGAVAIIGTLVLLVIFYLVRGPVRIESGRSGIKIVRFTGFERFVHWMTAVCFIVLALSGLNITFGRSLLLPLFGPETFSTLSELAKGNLLDPGVGRNGDGHERLCADLSILWHRRRQHGARFSRACDHRDALHRRHVGPYLYRHARDGRRLRSDG